MAMAVVPSRTETSASTTREGAWLTGTLGDAGALPPPPPPPQADKNDRQAAREIRLIVRIGVSALCIYYFGEFCGVNSILTRLDTENRQKSMICTIKGALYSVMIRIKKGS
jgi:hypothetical protein